jgi:hypothetical protein
MRAPAESTDHATGGMPADYRAGLLAGLAAGLATTPFTMAGATILMDLDPWAAQKMAWSLVAGKEVIRPGFELVPVMGGFAVHETLSGLFGLAFAVLASVSSASSLMAALFGSGLYVMNMLAAPKLLPGVAGHMFPANPLLHAASIAQHVAFGLLVGWAYRAWRRR